MGRNRVGTDGKRTLKVDRVVGMERRAGMRMFGWGRYWLGRQKNGRSKKRKRKR